MRPFFRGYDAWTDPGKGRLSAGTSHRFEAAFAGTDHYFEQHGNYAIRDYDYAIENGWIPEDYYEWWGFEDEKLFAFAKEELNRLYETGEPFNLTMATMDTHCVEGYTCELCEDTYENPIIM